MYLGILQYLFCINSFLFDKNELTRLNKGFLNFQVLQMIWAEKNETSYARFALAFWKITKGLIFILIKKTPKNILLHYLKMYMIITYRAQTFFSWLKLRAPVVLCLMSRCFLNEETFFPVGKAGIYADSYQHH